MIYNQLEIGDIQIFQRRQNYADKYTCKPPTYFIIIISLLQVLVYFFYLIKNGSNDNLPIDSILIFNSTHKYQFHRYLTYCLVHANWSHLIVNVLIQLLVGVPLEMVHGTGRVSFIYLMSVICSSMVFKMIYPGVYLMGASSAVFALLTAHLADVILNRDIMESKGLLRILGVIVILIIQLISIGINKSSSYQRTSLISHLTGSIVGLDLGFFVLKDFIEDEKKFLYKKISLCVTIYIILFLFFFNTFDAY